MRQQVEIIIGTDGKAQIKVINGNGVNCVELTKQLEQDLGIVSGDRTLLPEYQNPQFNQQSNQQDNNLWS
ncbi:MAG TPA: DUF2997 domain-containing protein [Nostocaceae cyanobacterium]|nr:DUF2997 domain-containing protein [Nostocaceae cyanobacterium]